VQAPGGGDEDTSGGFAHGGWHLRYFDDISQKWVIEGLTEAGGSQREPRSPAECNALPGHHGLSPTCGFRPRKAGREPAAASSRECLLSVKPPKASAPPCRTPPFRLTASSTPSTARRRRLSA
jgi:hypothetical protein